MGERGRYIWWVCGEGGAQNFLSRCLRGQGRGTFTCWFGVFPFALVWGGDAELKHQQPPWEGAEEGREGNSGDHWLCSLLHLLPSTWRQGWVKHSPQGSALARWGWGFLCVIFFLVTKSPSAIELHIRASVMAKTWRKFVLLLHEFMLQLPGLIRSIIS